MLIYTTKFKMDKSDLVLVNSAISSKMLRSMARKEGMLFEETLTGFKWMANSAHRFERDDGKTVLLCYEEAIGFMCGTRDSIHCCREIYRIVVTIYCSDLVYVWYLGIVIVLKQV